MSNMCSAMMSMPKSWEMFWRSRKKKPRNADRGSSEVWELSVRWLLPEPAPKHYHRVAATPVTPPLRH